MQHQIRLSRISYPRANLLGVLLLIAVFVLFGLWAQVFHPEWMQVSSLTMETSSTASSGHHWLQNVFVALKH